MMNKSDKLKSFLHALRRAVYPQRCLFCGQVISPSKTACEPCASGVERICGQVCQTCGRGKNRCVCRDKAVNYERVVAPFYYTGAVRECIRRFKFCGKTSLAVYLGDEMAQCVKQHCPDICFDAVVCVPMRERDKKQRGYNQSELLARQLAQCLNVLFDSEMLVQLYDVGIQHGLSALERSGNVFGIFDVADTSCARGKTLLLCDDVMTTGVTMNECAKMLMLHGAKRVVCVAAALAVQQD